MTREAVPRPDLDEGVADHPERARVGEGQGAMEEARFPDPLEAAHVAVAVEDVSAGEDRLGPGVAVVGHDHRHAGPDRALAADERTLASDDRGVTDADTGDVGDRVEAPGPALTDDDPQISCPYPVRVAHSGSNPWPPRTPARLAEAPLPAPRRLDGQDLDLAGRERGRDQAQLVDAGHRQAKLDLQPIRPVEPLSEGVDRP